MAYTYFIAYAYFEKPTRAFGGHGFGNIPIELSHPIANFGDVLEITNLIKAAMFLKTKVEMDISIINWQPFEPDVERKPRPTNTPDNVISLRGPQ